MCVEIYSTAVCSSEIMCIHTVHPFLTVFRRLTIHQGIQLSTITLLTFFFYLRMAYQLLMMKNDFETKLWWQRIILNRLKKTTDLIGIKVEDITRPPHQQSVRTIMHADATLNWRHHMEKLNSYGFMTDDSTVMLLVVTLHHITYYRRMREGDGRRTGPCLGIHMEENENNPKL